MLNPDLLQHIYDGTHAIRRIVTHDHCPDGTASAIILSRALSIDEPPVTFLQHGTEAYEQLVAEEGMIFCDISPPAARVQEFVDAGAIVLDHHVTAKAVVERFGDRGVYREGPGISGAMLAYEEIYWELGKLSGRAPLTTADRLIETMACLAAVRDTWQTSHPDWKRACDQAALLMFFPNRWWIEEGGLEHLVCEFEEDNPFDLMEVGRISTQNHLDAVKRACDEAYRFTTARGTRVVVIASTSLTSDAAELLGNTADLVLGFRYTVEGNRTKFIVSTRSHSDFDCAGFCKANGGGGHARAAGCAMPPIGTPYQQIHLMLHEWEGPHL